MTRTMLVSLALLGLVVFLMFRWDAIYNSAQPPIVTRIDIYPDRLTYRTGVYQSVSALAIGLKAANDPPRLIELHDCDGTDRLGEVLDIVRANGDFEFEIVLPEDC